MAKKFLLLCGIFSSIHYLWINAYVPIRYEGYSLSSYTVSELSAINAPTRGLWILLVIPYLLFFAAFGLGVLKSAGGRRPLKTMGVIILVYSMFNVYWPPMHQRGVAPTLTDTLHIAWAMVTVVLMIAMMIQGAIAFKRAFRYYTIVSIAIHLVFGTLTALDGPRIPKNEPTPLIGVWERINIGVFLLWVVVLTIELLRAKPPVSWDRLPAPGISAAS